MRLEDARAGASVLAPIGLMLAVIAENLGGLWTGSFVRRRIDAWRLAGQAPAPAEAPLEAEAAN